MTATPVRRDQPEYAPPRPPLQSPRAFAGSKGLTLPPKTGGLATTATFMPGRHVHAEGRFAGDLHARIDASRWLAISFQSAVLA